MQQVDDRLDAGDRQRGGRDQDLGDDTVAGTVLARQHRIGTGDHGVDLVRLTRDGAGGELAERTFRALRAALGLGRAGEVQLGPAHAGLHGVAVLLDGLEVPLELRITFHLLLQVVGEGAVVAGEEGALVLGPVAATHVHADAVLREVDPPAQPVSDGTRHLGGWQLGYRHAKPPPCCAPRSFP